MILFAAVIHKRRWKKLISKTINYKLDSSSKIQFAFFINFFSRKTIDFVENLEWRRRQGVGRRGGLCSLRHYDAMRTKIDLWFSLYCTRVSLYRVNKIMTLNWSLYCGTKLTLTSAWCSLGLMYLRLTCIKVNAWGLQLY